MTEVVSIVIPTLNRCEALREALGSVIAQTYPHWEALVVDDGSDDGTEPMVQELACTDKRIRFSPHQGPSAGAPTARNKGFPLSSGEYLLFLDSDDCLAPTCLERRLASFAEHPGVEFVVGGTAVFDTLPGDTDCLWNNFSDQNDLDRFLSMDVPWQTSGPLWRRSAVKQIEGWDEQALDWQDWEYHVRALSKRFSYVLLPVVDTYWRRSADGSGHVTTLNPDREFLRAELYARIRQILFSHGLLTADRDKMLSSAAAHLVRTHLYKRDFIAANKIFQLLRKVDLLRSNRQLALSLLWPLTHLPNNLLARIFIRLWVDTAIANPSVGSSLTRNLATELWDSSKMPSLNPTGLRKQIDE